jgi:hypothetical protein
VHLSNTVQLGALVNPLLLREHAREDVHVLDGRRLAQELVGLLHQRDHDRSGEVRLATVPSGKTSKIPKVDGPRRIANHAEVASSCSASGSAPSRKLATPVLPRPGFESRENANGDHAAPFCRLNSHGTELRFRQERA